MISSVPLMKCTGDRLFHEQHLLLDDSIACVQNVEIGARGEASRIEHDLIAPWLLQLIDQRRQLLAKEVKNIEANMDSRWQSIDDGGGGVKRIRIVLAQVEVIR